MTCLWLVGKVTVLHRVCPIFQSPLTLEVITGSLLARDGTLFQPGYSGPNSPMTSCRVVSREKDVVILDCPVGAGSWWGVTESLGKHMTTIVTNPAYVSGSTEIAQYFQSVGFKWDDVGVSTVHVQPPDHASRSVRRKRWNMQARIFDKCYATSHSTYALTHAPTNQ
jgi:hypothetical protein